MKKLTALILTLVMLVSMTAIVPVSAADVEQEIYPSTTAIEVAPGESFTLSWKTNIATGFDMEDVWVTYPEEFDVDTENYFIIGVNAMTEISFYSSTQFEVWVEEDDFFEVDADADLWAVTFTVPETVADGEYVISTELTDISTSDNYYGGDIACADVVVTVKTPSTLVEDTANLTADAYQIRVPYAGAEETTFGFRFISEVNVGNYKAKEFGTLVIPAAKLVGDLTVETADVAKVVAEKFMSETTETFKQYNATMVDIKGANYAVDFTYRPYIVLEDDSIVYGEVATANILETITALYADLNAEQQAWVAENVPGFIA